MAHAHHTALLVSPVGIRPGALFSAVHAVRAAGYGEPASCLLICSADTESRIPEAFAAAGYTGDWTALRLADPYGGKGEIATLAARAADPLHSADTVLVNLTGGTTLMGLVATTVADHARRWSRPVRRFGLVDRRPPGRQAEHPYQPGEAYWLDSEEGDGAGDH